MPYLMLLTVALGVAGLIPFLGCTIGILFFPADVPAPRLVQALIGYGAVILSFLGAVHWGLAMVEAPHSGPAVPRYQRLRIALGVLPALVGWTALLIPMVASPLLALLVLALGFLLTTLAEARARRANLIPPGYMALRWLLSAVVLICLVSVLLDRIT